MKLYNVLLVVVLVALLDAVIAARIARQSNEIPKTPEQEDPFPDDDDDDREDEDEGSDGFSLVFNLNPLHEFEKAFQHFEGMMKRFHDFMANATANIPNDYNSTTTDTVVIDGQKYNVRKSIVRKADNQSEIFIRAFQMVPSSERKKRSLALLK